MLFRCWASAVGDGPTLKQHWFNSVCLLGSCVDDSSSNLFFIHLYSHLKPLSLKKYIEAHLFLCTITASYKTYYVVILIIDERCSVF